MAVRNKFYTNKSFKNERKGMKFLFGPYEGYLDE